MRRLASKTVCFGFIAAWFLWGAQRVSESPCIFEQAERDWDALGRVTDEALRLGERDVGRRGAVALVLRGAKGSVRGLVSALCSC